MARGLILWPQTRINTSTFFSNSISKIPSIKCRSPFVSCHYHLLPLSRSLCKCSSIQEPIDMSKYIEAFSKRMAMAGLKPHHRIAMGVSGGADSMALCVLMAGWKTNGLGAIENASYIDGLLAIIVDHGLRSESKNEANMVSNRVTEMGIRSEIAYCDWTNGRPKQGHLQEEARDMRYQIFQKVCIRHQIGVLLTAHHADDQAELFVLRLSRSSGVLGLAGMPFTSQIFSTHTHSYDEVLKNYGILLVRPLLDFSKDDMYKMCQGDNQIWVEDPTNQNPLFARNRIRMSLGDLSSCTFNAELQAIISACRKTRLYIEKICSHLVEEAVTITEPGYAVIDLGIINRLKINDVCLSKFVSLVLQFISQRHRPIRGSTSKLVSDYIRTVPCKTSLTAAGCYLCPAPGSKGAKALVCCSVNSPLPSTINFFDAPSFVKIPNHSIPDKIEQIINDVRSYSDRLIPDASDVHFLDIKAESILNEAKRLNILSESTHTRILSLQREELKRFKPETNITSAPESEHEVKTIRLKSGQVCNIINRFFVTWNIRERNYADAISKADNCDGDMGADNYHCQCESGSSGCVTEVEVRHMVESDWLHLAKLSQQRSLNSANGEQRIKNKNRCFDYAMLSAQRALVILKSIPVAARRGLPVLVNERGLLLSIPSIGFSHCPYLIASAEFKPRVPLGGGYSSFI